MINKKRLISLTQRLIQINSENPSHNEKEIALFVKNYLEKIGLKCKIYEFKKDRLNVVALLKSPAKNAKTILITPHLDSVPAGKGWKFPPFEGRIKDERIYGRGASDCKCNLAVAMESLNSIIEDKAKTKNNILFAATADEEAGSKFGLIPLLKRGILKADYAVVLDADEFDIITTQKGLIHFKVTIFGKKAHGAYPWKGINAINIASDIINKLKEYKLKIPRKNKILKAPTINIGTIKGGDKVNIVADFCEFEVDIRYLPGMNANSILKEIKDIINKKTKRFKIQVNDTQKPYEISMNHPFVHSLLKTWRLYHRNARVRGLGGATVITFFKERGIPAVATGFGVKDCAHITDEYARIDYIYNGAKALEAFLKEGIKSFQ